MLKILSYLCYLFAVVDWCLAFFAGIDITGVDWSPVAAGVLGAILGAVADKNGEGNSAEEEAEE